MAGIGFATVPALYWLNRFNWRQVFKVGLLAGIALNLASAVTVDLLPLTVIRFFCGLSSGTIVAVCLTSFGLTRRPDRNYALWVAAQLLIGAFGLAILPHVMPQLGVKVVFLTLAAVLCIAMFFLQYVPVGQVTQAATEGRKSAGLNANSIIKIALGVAGLYLFYVALSGIWAYIERIAVSANIASNHIGYVLAIASILGIAGALSASLLDVRLGRFLPTVAGVATIVGGMFLLLGVGPASSGALLFFASGAFLFKYAWTFILPYFLAAISSQDKSGRAIVIANIFVGGGLASGPAIAAQFIDGGGYMPLITMGVACMLACFMLFLPLILGRNLVRQ